MKNHTHSFLQTFLGTIVILSIATGVQADDGKTSFDLAQRFYNDELYNLALEQYEKYLSLRQSAQKDPLVHFRIALCHYKMEDMREASEGFEEYLKLFPTDDNAMEATLLTAESRKATGDYHDASEWYYLFWKRYVGSAKARKALLNASVCAEKADNVERAIELYGLFLRRFPKHVDTKEVYLSLAGLLIRQKQYPGAGEHLADAEKRWSDDKSYVPRLLYYKARLARVTQATEEAGRYYSELGTYEREQFPEKEAALRDYVVFLEQQEKYDGAVEVYRKLANLYRTGNVALDPEFLRSWAEAARRARKYDEAEKLYKELLSADPSHPQKGLILYRTAECQAGREAFTQAIETLRELAISDSAGEYGARALLKMGDLYYGKELYSSTITVYRKYLRLPAQPFKDKVTYRIGKILQENYGRHGAALSELETVVRLYPSSQYYHPSVYAIAQCHEAKRDYEAAIRQYDYLVEVGAQRELADKARSRSRYLRSFFVKDTEGASMALAAMAEDALRGAPRRHLAWKIAEIYSSYLRQYAKALDVYDMILRKEPAPPDSVIARALYLKAEVVERLYEKASFEHSTETAAYMKKEALSLHHDILARFGGSVFADGAAFRTMMLISPNIAEYEAFIEKYPGSRYRAQVLLAVGHHYESKSDKVDKRFAAKAVAAYQALVTDCPSDSLVPDALVGLARNLLALKQVDSAAVVVDGFLRRPGESDAHAEILALKGEVLKRQGDHAGALDAFKTLLYSYPFSSHSNQARYEIALAQLETGQVLEALSNFRSYLQDFPEGPLADRTRYGIAQCLVRVGKSDQAEPVLKELLSAKLPKRMKTGAHFELARIAEDNGKVYAALDHYKKVLAERDFPSWSKVIVHVADLYFDNRLFGDAAKTYQDAFKHATTEAETLTTLTGEVVSLIMSGKGKSAGKKIRFLKERFEESQPSCMTEVIYHEGLHLMNGKDYDKAVNRFVYILEKMPESERADDATYQIALCRFYDNKKEQALAEFKEFAVKYPQSELVPLARFKIGMVLHGSEEFLQAAHVFSDVARAENGDAQTQFRAANNAAIAYQKVSAWDEASQMYKLVLKRFPDRLPASSLNLKIGFCLVQASQFEQALRHFRRANVSPDPQDKPEVIYWIATCLGKLGQYEKAISEYLKVPYLYADAGKWGVTAELEAARLYERLEEFEKAQTLYKKIVRTDGERGRFGKQASSRLQRLNNLTTADN